MASIINCSDFMLQHPAGLTEDERLNSDGPVLPESVRIMLLILTQKNVLRSLCTIARLSVCRPAVCNVRAHYSAG